MEIEPGEVICDKCNGTGETIRLFMFNYSGMNEHGERKDMCPKCKGDGKLDWIDNVLGKKPVFKFKMHHQWGVRLMDHHIGSSIITS
mgnify:CR=1 FL=1